MKLSKSTIAATFATILIAGLAANPASAKVRHETGRVDTTEHLLNFELSGTSSYVSGRQAPEGTQPILRSSAGGKTNGRQG